MIIRRNWYARIILISVFALGFAISALAQSDTERRPYLNTGLFIGSIEEGARIFTPARMLPLDHPESMGHDFPTILQMSGGEDRALVMLGEKIGLKLAATLQRYPRLPDTSWRYPEFAPPPLALLADAPVTTLKANQSPLPGLRAVAFVSRQPVNFIIDTRGLTLKERGMTRATTSGLDITRDQFNAALDSAALAVPAEGAAILVYEKWGRTVLQTTRDLAVDGGFCIAPSPDGEAPRLLRGRGLG